MRSKLLNSLILFLAVLVSSTVMAAEMKPLFRVIISPEARVRVVCGEVERALIQGVWREFEIEIENTAGITSALQIESENLIIPDSAVQDRNRWLRLELIPVGPLTGKLHEKRKLRLWSSQPGVRSAVLNANAGQGTQDLGFRSDLLLSFKIQAAATVGAPDGWWAGSLNCPGALTAVPTHMQTQNLHIAQFQSWVNDENPWAGRALPSPLISATPDGRFFSSLAGRDERVGGPLQIFNLKEPFPLAGYPAKTEEWPPSVFLLEMTKRRGAWVDAGTVDSLDFPFWLASGKLDSIGLALSAQGAGYLRDLVKFPSPAGDRLWAQELYFRALNCGIRLPPSSGNSALARTEVFTGESLTWQSWWDGFKAGRVIVSQGLQLRVTANNQLPGDFLKTEQGPLQVSLTGNLTNPDSNNTVEFIRNGQAEIIKLPALVTINESGWFLVRATADADPAQFAMTAPWYVEIGGQAMQPRKQDTEFFQEWTNQRMAAVRNAIPEPDKQKSAFEVLAAAEIFWQEKAGTVRKLTQIRGRILDPETSVTLPARIYIRNAQGSWFFPESKGGTAIRYEKRNFNNLLSSENHTTLSAHPWQAELPPGRYTITVERGKEWFPLIREIEVGEQSQDIELPLQRWVNMAAEGWFSGETHVHRLISELPNVMLAEDLNVAFPLSYWCLHAHEVPYHYDKCADPSKPAELFIVDATHVFWPCNTEWEIFGVGGHDHTLGAVFALGHSTPILLGAPLLGPIAREARRQGAMLDMDKPDWPWAMALPPIMGIDLYELSNNHVWRVPFALNKWTTPAPEWMLPHASSQGNERDWLEYTHQVYWALLNAGQRLRPSAGTASGVHPVPLGFSRVYVHCPDGFSYDHWRAGLQTGRSFVTTGPMCISEITRKGDHAAIHAKVNGQLPLGTLEIIVNGAIAQTIEINSRDAIIDRTVPLDGTTWIALRLWEPQPDGRLRFAHTSPVWFDDPAKPLRPRREQAEFLAHRVRDEIQRSTPILSPAAIQEYQQALRQWEQLSAEKP